MLWLLRVPSTSAAGKSTASSTTAIIAAAEQLQRFADDLQLGALLSGFPVFPLIQLQSSFDHAGATFGKPLVARLWFGALVRALGGVDGVVETVVVVGGGLAR